MPADPPYDEASPSQSGSGEVPTCYRHPERETYIRCQRCERYTCPDCSREAAVGVHCVECLQAGNRDLPRTRNPLGGVARADGPIVCYVLIGLNLAGWLLNYATGQALTQELATFAGLPGSGIGLVEGEFWRLLTGAFVHQDLWHIGFNMLALYFLGPALERLLGRLRFVGLYLISALFSGALVYLVVPFEVWTIGASGAIFGLFGTVIMLRHWLRVDLTWIIVILGINVVVNIFYRDSLSVTGHVGGLVAGVLLGVALARAPREHQNRWHTVGYFVVVALALVATAVRTLVYPYGIGA